MKKVQMPGPMLEALATLKQAQDELEQRKERERRARRRELPAKLFLLAVAGVLAWFPARALITGEVTFLAMLAILPAAVLVLLVLGVNHLAHKRRRTREEFARELAQLQAELAARK